MTTQEIATEIHAIATTTTLGEALQRLIEEHSSYANDHEAVSESAHWLRELSEAIANLHCVLDVLWTISYRKSNESDELE